jgi:hypothetical protein
MIIHDLVILGRATPQHLKNGRTTVCLGGWSYEHGFIRIYPTKPRMGLRRWDVIKVEVERNKSDTRQESWKIVQSRDNWDYLENSVTKAGRVKKASAKREIITKNVTSCVAELNNNHISLGLIKPEVIHRAYFGKNAHYGKPVQMALFSTHAKQWAKVKSDYPREPRIRYTCSNCQTKQGFHDSVILEWGFYEWMRKNPDNIEQIWENARFFDDDYDVYFFVGNQQNQRTSYIVINSIPLKKTDDPLPERLL